MSGSRVVGAVEIGTSKVAVLLGEVVDSEALNIIGRCVCSSKGVKKGAIADLDAASDCVHSAIMKAEKDANTRIDEVYLSQTGNHLQGNFNVGTANVSSPDGIVRQVDIDQVKADAKRRKLPVSRTYIHHIQNPYSLDGAPVDNPISREARQLQVGYWSVHGDSDIVSDSLRVIRGIDLDVSDVIISSIASGAVLLEDSEKDNGALVIDIGGGTTDYVLYRKGYIVKTGVVPVGGDHITNDLSIGLRVSRKHAEDFKVRYGQGCYESAHREEKVWLFGDLTIGDREYPLAALTRIIETRVGEVFEIIKEQLQEAEVYDPVAIASGIILTGGSSRLVAIERCAEKHLGLPVRCADGPAGVDPELCKPEYSTALGLLHYALTGQEEKKAPAKSVSILRKLSGLLNLE